MALADTNGRVTCLHSDPRHPLLWGVFSWFFFPLLGRLETSNTSFNLSGRGGRLLLRYRVFSLGHSRPVVGNRNTAADHNNCCVLQSFTPSLAMGPCVPNPGKTRRSQTQACVIPHVPLILSMTGSDTFVVREMFPEEVGVLDASGGGEDFSYQ